MSFRECNNVENKNLCLQTPTFIEWLKPSSSSSQTSSISSSPPSYSLIQHEQLVQDQTIQFLPFKEDQHIGVQKEGLEVKEEKKVEQVTVALHIGLPNTRGDGDQKREKGDIFLLLFNVSFVLVFVP